MQVRKLIAGTACALMLLAAMAQTAALAQSPPSPPLAVDKIMFHFCTLRIRDGYLPFAVQVDSALMRFANSGYLDAGLMVQKIYSKDDACFAKTAKGCFGEKGAVYCDLDAIATALNAIAWLAASGTMQDGVSATGEKIPIFRVQLGIEDALKLAYAELDGPGSEEAKRARAAAFEKIMKPDGRENPSEEAIRQVVELGFTHAYLLRLDQTPGEPLDKANLEGLPQKLEPRVALAYVVYEAAVNYLFAYILGHEFSHAYRSCVFRQPSLLETSGRFVQIRAMQIDDKLLHPIGLTGEESQAELCALRGVEQMDDGMVAFKQARGNAKTYLALLTLSRRMAIDGASIILTLAFGHRPEEKMLDGKPMPDGTPTVGYIMESEPGNFYPALRVALLAELLLRLDHSGTGAVRLCDSTAQRFVLGLNFARALRSQRASSGSHAVDQRGFPEMFWSIVPAGVVKGWQINRWDDKTSFRCTAAPSPPR